MAHTHSHRTASFAGLGVKPMRWAFAALMGAIVLTACSSERAPHPYPQSALERFSMSCPPESAVCTCTWDKITRTVTYDEYEAALARV